jgi:hypothetical protein
LPSEELGLQAWATGAWLHILNLFPHLGGDPLVAWWERVYGRWGGKYFFNFLFKKFLKLQRIVQ